MIEREKRSSIWVAVVYGVVLLSGCVDSPLHSLYYRKQWQDDEKYGPTLFTRLEELQNLRQEAARMNQQQQAQLAGRLNMSVVRDPSAVYRAEVVRTLGALSTAAAIEGLQAASQDEEPVVRIAACEAWGQRGGVDAQHALGTIVRSDGDLDVRIVAARELGNFKDQAAIQSLGAALDDPNPALQFRAVESLRRISDEDFGNNVPAWRQYVRGEPVDHPEPPSIVDRLLTFF
jgi:HEAT repeat protein